MENADEGVLFDPVAYLNAPRWQQVKPGLTRIRALLENLGRPQDSLRFVHVAGTNGKGSVCAFISSVLQEAGYTTGLFTSPYIECFEERIRVNGQNISLPELRDITLEVRSVAEKMEEHPTEFELMCAVGLLHFARRSCDVVVMEVGLGGRWDATNIIDAPEVAVICRLGLDHTGLLGNTIEEIAAEKAGIVKQGRPTVCWPQESEAMQVIEQACQKSSSELTVCDFSALSVSPLRLDREAREMPLRRFTYRNQTFETRLLGSYQPANAALALETLRLLREGGWHISKEALRKGISNTLWPGRFEVCDTRPLFVIDGGHNPQGAAVMAETLTELLPDTKPVFIIGLLADKDYPAMLDAVAPLASAFVCATPPVARALAADALAEALACKLAAIDSDAPISIAEDYCDAVRRARILAGSNGAICAFGSLYAIASLKTTLKTEGSASVSRVH